MTLQGFILQAKAHAGQEVPAELAKDHIARAHQVRGVLIKTPPIEQLVATLAHQKKS